MRRIGYIPYDPIREQEKEDWLKERRAMRNADCEPDPEPHARFGFLNPDEDEYQSVDALAEYLIDEDRESYNCHELQCVWFNEKRPIADVKADLAEWGLTLERRPVVREVRGFTANCHNRWTGHI